MKFYKALALGLVLFAFGTGSQLKAQGANAMPPAAVSVISAKSQSHKMTFTYPARLASPQSVTLLPKVSGTLISQNFQPGDIVKKGDVLFELDDEIYAAQAASARAAAASAAAEFKRVEQLFKQNAASQKEYDLALAAKDSSAAALKLAELNLGYAKVKAPFSGVVGENLSDVGSFVVANNTPLVRISKLDKLQARFYISDTENLVRKRSSAKKAWLQSDDKVSLDINGLKFNGKLIFIDSTIDPKSGAVLAKASFDNQNGELMPGAVGHISLDNFVLKSGIKIPQIAILQNSSGAYVLVVKDNKVEPRAIKIAYQKPEFALISQGLNDGDLVITDNFMKIRPGAPVSIASIDGKPAGGANKVASK